MSNSQQLEVVGRGSETQLQVGENSNQLTQSNNNRNGITTIEKVITPT